MNGRAELDLTRFDAVLVIGDTLGMPQTLFMAAQYDVADWPARHDRPLISTPAFLAAMEEVIGVRADHLAAQFPGPSRRFSPRWPPTPRLPSPGGGGGGRGGGEGGAGRTAGNPYCLPGSPGHPELPRIHALYRRHAEPVALEARAGINLRGPNLPKPWQGRS